MLCVSKREQPLPGTHPRRPSGGPGRAGRTTHHGQEKEEAAHLPQATTEAAGGTADSGGDVSGERKPVQGERNLGSPLGRQVEGSPK